MAARAHDPLRPKHFHSSGTFRAVDSEKAAAPADAVHGHFWEYAAGLTGLFTNVLFLVGSICFFPSMPEWAVFLGDYLYIVGSVLTFGLAAWTLHESWVAQSHQAGGSAGKAVEMMQASEEARETSEKRRNEFMENLNFVMASVVFLAGTLLFMPRVYSGEDSERRGHEAGAWCFIVGSFGFVFASFFNALGLASEHGYRHPPGSPEARCVQMSKIALFVSLVGGVLFVTGSFLYRPGYTNTSGCRHAAFLSASSRPAAAVPALFQRRAGHATWIGPDATAPFGHWQLPPSMVAQDLGDRPPCVNALEHGTWLYVIGSVLFVAQSALQLASTYTMHDATGGRSAPASQRLQHASTFGLGDGPAGAA